ncbi:hypothetical protein BDP81DRAFT_21618 [Colletotrichum phormii]|uniref:Uncharacterized protein n=1 Tax=Colletotrichum phormii TaxID=359342 RepID=A0AAJ0A4R0_9PEZI|nr:uncharacterized protein BDP81DRAFT_21618 [Colletotrichum phormii]KAK1656457.1 hypothetical protein BDP81DRAFT_21618 [Colletotrichum phormii]
MLFSKSAHLTLSLLAVSITASPLSSTNTLERRDPQNGPPRFSCSCVNGKTRKMKAVICNGAGGATGVDSNKDGEACNGLITKLTTSDCQALVDPKSKVECVQTG